MNLPRTFHQARRLLGSSDLLASPFISRHLPKCMQARRLLGSSAPLREAMSKLAGLEKEEKQRQRKLYGGTIQGAAVHQLHEASERARLQRCGRLTLTLADPEERGGSPS